MENVFRSYTNRSFSRPNVSTVTSRLLHAFCITHDAPRALIVFLTGRSKHRTRATAFSFVEDQPATLAFLKPRVAELIEELIGVNNKGFNSDLEENTAPLNADFYP